MQFRDGPLSPDGYDADLYVPRSFEAGLLETALSQPNVLVSGPRGSGKTTSLRKLAADLREHGLRVVVVNAAPARSVADLVALVTDALQLPPLQDDPSLATPVVTLVRAVRHLAQAPQSTIVMVDADDVEALYELFGRLREEVWALQHQWIVEAESAQSDALRQPPADGFFNAHVRVGELDQWEIKELLRRGLDDDELRKVSAGTMLPLRDFPREVVRFARGALDGTLEHELDAGRRRDELAVNVGRRAHMALKEVEARREPISADDGVLLARMGWTRGHAARALAQMEQSGLLRSFDERISARGGGRPRRLYLPHPDPPRQ